MPTQDSEGAILSPVMEESPREEEYVSSLEAVQVSSMEPVQPSSLEPVQMRSLEPVPADSLDFAQANLLGPWQGDFLELAPMNEPAPVNLVDSAQESSLEPAQISSLELLETQPATYPHEWSPYRPPEDSTETAGASLSANDKILYFDHPVQGHPVQLPKEKYEQVKVAPIAKKWWILELASLLLAMSTLGGIIALLATQNDQEQASWRYLPNMTTLLSILGAILTAALLFPLAQISTQTGWKGAFLAAILALLSVAVAPFPQQAIRSYPCSKLANATAAMIFRTNLYTDVPVFDPAPESNRVRGMMGMIYKGFIDPPGFITPLGSCPSGYQCVFGHDVGAVDTFSSLAMCSSVQDLQGQIRHHGSKTPGGWNASLPSGHSLLPGSVMSTRQVVSKDASWTGENEPLYIFEILMASASCDRAAAGGMVGVDVGCLNNTRAFNVTLFPCVNKYGNITVVNGVKYMDTLSTARLPLVSGYSLVTEKFPGPASKWDSFAYADCSPSANSNGDKDVETIALPSGRRGRYPGAGSAYERVNTTFYDLMCVYEMSDKSSAGFRNVFAGMFGTESDIKSLDIPNAAHGPVVGEMFLRPMWKGGMADFDSVKALIDGLTWSMTVALAVGAGFDTPYRGGAFQDGTCVGVDWPWLSYPAAVVILVVVFFTVASMRKGRDIDGRHSTMMTAA